MNRLQWLLVSGLSGAVTILAILPVDAMVQPLTPMLFERHTVNAPDSVASNSCLPEPAESSPRSVKVIERNQIEQRATANFNLGSILVDSVPGLSFRSEAGRSGLLLRGRRVSVLIDRVPVGRGDAALSSLDPDLVERIEVIPGPSQLCQ